MQKRKKANCQSVVGRKFDFSPLTENEKAKEDSEQMKKELEI